MSESLKNKKSRKRVQDHEAVGMWADREDMKDVGAYVRRLRKPREHGIRRGRKKR